MPPGAGVADVMRSAMPSQHAGEWLLQAPPDLSLSARLRGADWLYAYLRGFYRDESAPAGWNNAIFEGVAMPHALASLQGERRLEDGELQPPAGGRLSAAEYDLLVADLVNFMDYAADPARPQRHRAGYLFISVLLVLFMLAYFVYRDYWREIR
jgi:ubiquinol-cytochrome c reductase cytochrome c1 subunit